MQGEMHKKSVDIRNVDLFVAFMKFSQFGIL